MPSRTATAMHPHPLQSYRGPRELLMASLGALGVVYGDIGTSPLYALKECLTGPHSVVATHANVLGILSLVFWSLTLVIVVKYLTFILRADNKGEGGILALCALVRPAREQSSPGWLKLTLPVLLALFGAGLLYGDGAITPVISVLGAVEGLQVATHTFDDFVVPITTAIIVLLFLVQKHGTERIGNVFGWVMLVWFAAIAAAGIPAIARYPSVVHALDPSNAVRFFLHNGWHGFFLLGSVVLVITGGEALYADMGHFGRKPIRLAWYAVVFPAVLLNYFGQGALLLAHEGEPIVNPFYALVDGPLLYPMVVLATMAAVIASQALISGVFSLTHQAVQLGYSPRVTIIHTSDKAEGQIYIPEVNFLLMVACITLTLSFRTSSSLAAAYGIAVTGTMAITSVLYFKVSRVQWKTPLRKAIPLLVAFLAIDCAFLGANVTKVADGGWVPLAIGAGVFAIMTTWWRGRMELSEVMGQATLPDDLFMMDVAETRMPRVPGTAVFMASSTEGIPNVLLHHVKHIKTLHRQVVLLSIIGESVPWVAGNESITVRELGHGFFRVVARQGFMQTPKVPRILARCKDKGIDWNEPDTTYFLGRQTLLVGKRAKMARWRKMMFAFLNRNARSPTAFFGLPPNRVVELGLQIEL